MKTGVVLLLLLLTVLAVAMAVDIPKADNRVASKRDLRGSEAHARSVLRMMNKALDARAAALAAAKKSGTAVALRAQDEPEVPTELPWEQAKAIMDAIYQAPGSKYVMNNAERALNEQETRMLMCHLAQLKAGMTIIGKLLLVPKITLVVVSLAKGAVNPVALLYALAMAAAGEIIHNGDLAGALVRAFTTGSHRTSMMLCITAQQCGGCGGWLDCHKSGSKTVFEVGLAAKRTTMLTCSSDNDCASDTTSTDPAPCTDGPRPACAKRHMFNSCTCVVEVSSTNDCANKDDIDDL